MALSLSVQCKWNPKSHRCTMSNPTFVSRGRSDLKVKAGMGAEENQLEIQRMSTTSFEALQQLKNSGAANRYTREKSCILVIGLSYHTAPVEMREKLAIPEAELPLAIAELCKLNHIEEAAVLSTCNRMEIYAVALSWHRGIREVTEWMSTVYDFVSSWFRDTWFT